MFDETNKYKTLDKQSNAVKQYFKLIGEEDPYNLDVEGFFERVCASIETNDLVRTCEIYNLHEEIIRQIEMN